MRVPFFSSKSSKQDALPDPKDFNGPPLPAKQKSGASSTLGAKEVYMDLQKASTISGTSSSALQKDTVTLPSLENRKSKGTREANPDMHSLSLSRSGNNENRKSKGAREANPDVHPLSRSGNNDSPPRLKKKPSVHVSPSTHSKYAAEIDFDASNSSAQFRVEDTSPAANEKRMKQLHTLIVSPEQGSSSTKISGLVKSPSRLTTTSSGVSRNLSSGDNLHHERMPSTNGDSGQLTLSRTASQKDRSHHSSTSDDYNDEPRQRRRSILPPSTSSSREFAGASQTELPLNESRNDRPIPKTEPRQHRRSVVPPSISSSGEFTGASQTELPLNESRNDRPIPKTLRRGSFAAMDQSIALSNSNSGELDPRVLRVARERGRRSSVASTDFDEGTTDKLNLPVLNRKSSVFNTNNSGASRSSVTRTDAQDSQSSLTREPRNEKEAELFQKMAAKRQDFLERQTKGTASSSSLQNSVDHFLTGRTTLKRLIKTIDPENKAFKDTKVIKVDDSFSYSMDRDVTGEEFKLVSTEELIRKWHKALKLYQMFSFLLSIYKTASMTLSDYQKALQARQESFNFLAKFHQRKVDPLLSRRVIDLVTGKKKADTDYETLERLLRMRLRSFASYTQEQRLRFCRIMSYEKHQPGKIIIKEADYANAFYFVLSGQLEIFKQVGTDRCPLNILSGGDSFGDRTMYKIGDKRTASVQVLVECELLAIDKREFVAITKLGEEETEARRLARIVEMPSFIHAPEGFCKRILPFCRFQTFETHTPIILEGSHLFQIYWILSGSCRSVKVVPFYKKLINHTHQYGNTYQTLAFVKGETVLGPGDEILRELLSIHDIPTGSHFPNLPKASGIDGLQNEQFSQRDYIAMIRVRELTGQTDVSPVSVIANEKVEVMYMSRLEFVEIATREILLATIQNDYISDASESQLQAEWLEKRQWELHKKKISKQIVDDKATASSLAR